MKYDSLSPRLELIASLVPVGSFPVDVGTDHGYLPAWLLKNGIVQRCAATDINSGPLAAAARTLDEAGVRNKCQLFLCDGLADCGNIGVDAVIIAGMGGDNISGILERAPWARQCGPVILQPMSKSERLRFWLCANGYEIFNELLVRDNGRLYPVICARGAENVQRLSAEERYTGKLELVMKQPLFPELLDELISRFERAVDSQLSGGSNGAHLMEMKSLLQGFRRIREENFQ